MLYVTTFALSLKYKEDLCSWVLVSNPFVATFTQTTSSSSAKSSFETRAQLVLTLGPFARFTSEFLFPFPFIPRSFFPQQHSLHIRLHVMIIGGIYLGHAII